MSDYKAQCDFCAFCVVEDQSTPESDIAIENKYKVLRGLSGAPKKPRVIDMALGLGSETNKTQTCFINAPLWPTLAKTTHCPDRLDASLSLAEALAIHKADTAIAITREQATVAREQAVVAHDAKIWAIIAVIIATIAAIIAIKP
jgi:hypothetical protein